MALRVDDVARAVLDELGPIEAMKLEKLVYYVQAWHVAVYDEVAFEDPIEAWRDGPVVDHLYQQHRQRRMVAAWPSGDASELPEETATIVKAVAGIYGELSGDDLSQLTHTEGPWVAARSGLDPNQRSRRVIPPESLKSYYRRKRLAGRLPADLAVGGFHYGNVGLVDRDEVREIVKTAKVRALKEQTGDDVPARVPLISDDSDVIVSISRKRPDR